MSSSTLDLLKQNLKLIESQEALNKEIITLKQENAYLKEVANNELQEELVRQFPTINKICNNNKFEKMVIEKVNDSICLETIHSMAPKRSHVFYLNRASQVENFVKELPKILNDTWRVEHHYD